MTNVYQNFRVLPATNEASIANAEITCRQFDETCCRVSADYPDMDAENMSVGPPVSV